ESGDRRLELVGVQIDAGGGQGRRDPAEAAAAALEEQLLREDPLVEAAGPAARRPCRIDCGIASPRRGARRLNHRQFLGERTGGDAPRKVWAHASISCGATIGPEGSRSAA